MSHSILLRIFLAVQVGLLYAWVLLAISPDSRPRREIFNGFLKVAGGIALILLAPVLVGK